MTASGFAQEQPDVFSKDKADVMTGDAYGCHRINRPNIADKRFVHGRRKYVEPASTQLRLYSSEDNSWWQSLCILIFLFTFVRCKSIYMALLCGELMRSSPYVHVVCIFIIV